MSLSRWVVVLSRLSSNFTILIVIGHYDYCSKPCIKLFQKEEDKVRGSKPEEGPARIAGDGAIVKACPGRRPANQARRLYQTFHPLKPLQKQLDSFKVGGWKSISRSVPRKVCSDHTDCRLMGMQWTYKALQLVSKESAQLQSGSHL